MAASTEGHGQKRNSGLVWSMLHNLCLNQIALVDTRINSVIVEVKHTTPISISFSVLLFHVDVISKYNKKGSSYDSSVFSLRVIKLSINISFDYT